jgi:hypothetical protein
VNSICLHTAPHISSMSPWARSRHPHSSAIVRPLRRSVSQPRHIACSHPSKNPFVLAFNGFSRCQPVVDCCVPAVACSLTM